MSSGRRHALPATVALSSYDQRILADSPVLYLLLSGGSAGAADRSGNGLTATAVGNPVVTAFPDGGVAAVFDGATQYLEVADNGLLSVTNTGILTLEAWIRPDTLQFTNQEGSGYVYWMGKNTAGQSEYSCRMYSYTNTEHPVRPNRISGYAFNLNGGLGVGSYFQDAVTAGDWMYYVLVINTVNTSSAYPKGYTKLYKNGAFRDQDTLASLNIVPGHGSAPFRVGSVTLNSFFQGAIAKVAVYNHELSPAAIRAHYQTVYPPVAGTTAWIGGVGTAAATTSGTTLALTVGSAGVSAGTTLIVRVAHSYTAGGPVVVDSRGNTYTRDQSSPNAAATMRASLFSAQINNALQPGDTILLTTSAATNVRVMAVDAFSGILFSSPLDVKNSTSNAGSTTPGRTISITTTNADDMLVGFVTVYGPASESYTEDGLESWSGLARAGTTSGAGDITVNSAYQVVGSTGMHHYQPTLGTSESWIEIIAAYKAGDCTPTPAPTGSVLFMQNIGSDASKTLGSTLTIVVPDGGVMAGHTLIVRVLHDYTAAAPTISDSRGNIYTRDRTAADSGTTMRASVFSAPILTALQAGDVITMNTSMNVAVRVFVVDEFANVAGPVVVDAQNGQSGSSATPSVSNTTTNADDLLVTMVGVAGDVNDGYTEDAVHQWTSLARVGTAGDVFNSNRTINGAYRVVGAAGAYTYAPVLGTSSAWIEFSIGYRAGPVTIAPPPSGTAAWVQNIGTASSKTTGNSLTISVPAGGVPIGHTLIVRVLHDYTSGAPTASDSRGNIYARDRTAADGSQTMRVTQFSCPVESALLAGDSIVVMLSGPVAVRCAAVDEFSGVLTPIVVDAQNGLTGVGTLPTLTVTNSHADDLLIGMVGVAGDVADVYTEDTPNIWTGLTRVGTSGGIFDTNRTINSAYRSVGTSGTYHYSPTLGMSSTWIEFIVAYQAP